MLRPMLFATALLAGTLLTPVSPHARAQPLALAPGVAFAWTDPATDAVLVYRIADRPRRAPEVHAIRLERPHLRVTRFEFRWDAAQLIVRVRADTPGVYDIPRLWLETRDGPVLAVEAGASRVLALRQPTGAFHVRRATTAHGTGLYLAAAVENLTARPLRVRALRYAPYPLGDGMVLTAHGPVDAFASWQERVMRRTIDAYDVYLREEPARLARGATATDPATLAFDVDGLGHGSRWRPSGELSMVIAPGEALYYAITPAAFDAYVDDLSLVAYPVLSYEQSGVCCHLAGDGSVLQHLP